MGWGWGGVEGGIQRERLPVFPHCDRQLQKEMKEGGKNKFFIPHRVSHLYAKDLREKYPWVNMFVDWKEILEHYTSSPFEWITLEYNSDFSSTGLCIIFQSLLSP